MRRPLFGLILMASCDPGLILAPRDGGFDAGLDDGGVDAGFSDAGFSDAGFADAGFADAGFAPRDAGHLPQRCPFPPAVPDPRPCEGDEDFCDPVEERFHPEVDLISVWSRETGGFFEVQVSTAAPMFRDGQQARLAFLFDLDGDGTGPLSQVADPARPMERVRGDVLIELRQDPFGHPSYPPAPSARFSPDHQHIFDECALQLGRDAAVAAVRVPLEWFSAPPRYVVVAEASDDFPPTSDVSWDEAPAHLTSNGGRADESDDLESICRLTCPSQE